jgi:hypothetical protein
MGSITPDFTGRSRGSGWGGITGNDFETAAYAAVWAEGFDRGRHEQGGRKF